LKNPIQPLKIDITCFQPAVYGVLFPNYSHMTVTDLEIGTAAQEPASSDILFTTPSASLRGFKKHPIILS
jgi:hypothetical protein